MSYKVGPLNRGKYIVTKASGKPTDPKACYFVLRLDTDPHARDAALTYALSVRKENQQLADDLHDWLNEIEAGGAGSTSPAPPEGELPPA